MVVTVLSTCLEQAGYEVYTVPAHETYVLTALPYYMAREVAAMWVYFLQPFAVPRLRSTSSLMIGSL